METGKESIRLRIYISSTDKFRHSLLSETLVFAARRYGLAGATVIRGSMGFGSSSIVHSSKFWEITEKLPVVIEMIDEASKIEHFMKGIRPWFDKIPTGCLITTEKIEIVLFKQGIKKKFFTL